MGDDAFTHLPFRMSFGIPISLSQLLGRVCNHNGRRIEEQSQRRYSSLHFLKNVKKPIDPPVHCPPPLQKDINVMVAEAEVELDKVRANARKLPSVMEQLKQVLQQI